MEDIEQMLRKSSSSPMGFDEHKQNLRRALLSSKYFETKPRFNIYNFLTMKNIAKLFTAFLALLIIIPTVANAQLISFVARAAVAQATIDRGEGKYEHTKVKDVQLKDEATLTYDEVTIESWYHAGIVNLNEINPEFEFQSLIHNFDKSGSLTASFYTHNENQYVCSNCPALREVMDVDGNIVENQGFPYTTIRIDFEKSINPEKLVEFENLSNQERNQMFTAAGYKALYDSDSQQESLHSNELNIYHTHTLASPTESEEIQLLQNFLESTDKEEKVNSFATIVSLPNIKYIGSQIWEGKNVEVLEFSGKLLMPDDGVGRGYFDSETMQLFGIETYKYSSIHSKLILTEKSVFHTYEYTDVFPEINMDDYIELPETKPFEYVDEFDYYRKFGTVTEETIYMQNEYVDGPVKITTGRKK